MQCVGCMAVAHVFVRVSPIAHDDCDVDTNFFSNIREQAALVPSNHMAVVSVVCGVIVVPKNMPHQGYKLCHAVSAAPLPSVASVPGINCITNSHEPVGRCDLHSLTSNITQACLPSGGWKAKSKSTHACLKNQRAKQHQHVRQVEAGRHRARVLGAVALVCVV